jgi:hypothetical protein
MNTITIKETIINLPENIQDFRIEDGKILVDNQIVGTVPSTEVILIVNGKPFNITVKQGKVLSKRDIAGNVCVGQGSVNAHNVGGYISCNGNVNAGDVQLGVRAGGNVIIRKAT